jgi:phosphoribosylamine---glycine ligase
MRILVVGSGGREHALAWAISASPLVERVYCAPGNAGIAQDAECVPVDATDTAGLIEFSKKSAIDLVVVGPEAPLVAGLVDALEGEGIAAFGPSRAAAALEGSKGFMKDLCAREGIPTAAYRRFTDAAAAKAYVAAQGAPIVVKADGLAAGKGVVVAATLAEANAAVDAAFGGRFGAAGAEIVVEEFLAGEEASFFALCDGTHALPLAAAQDHKRVGDGDTGPNTGGMGAYSPCAAVTPEIEGQVMERIVMPTLRAMAKDGRPYKGVLYAGLMLTAEGPKLIEYNVRFGDPECQALMMRLQSDLAPALLATRDSILDRIDLRWYDAASVCVVMAADGYPDDPRRGTEIRGLAAIPTLKSSMPARGATATASSPMAEGYSASPRPAPISPPRATAPTARSTGSTGRADSAGAISGSAAGLKPALAPASIRARPVLADGIAPVPVSRRLAHLVEDAHAGGGRLGHLDDGAGVALFEEVDEGPSLAFALLADMPAARERLIPDLAVVHRPARPVLSPFLAGIDEIPIQARRPAALLDQFELDVARIGERDRQMRDVVGLALIAVRGQRQLVGIEPRADAAHLNPVLHRLVDVLDDDADLPHVAENPAHGFPPRRSGTGFGRRA